jgi:hypothetical protein
MVIYIRFAKREATTSYSSVHHRVPNQKRGHLFVAEEMCVNFVTSRCLAMHFCDDLTTQAFYTARHNIYIYKYGLDMFPLLASCNEFALTPIVVPLDSSIKRDAYRRYT